jgi:hypothetical protein
MNLKSKSYKKNIKKQPGLLSLLTLQGELNNNEFAECEKQYATETSYQKRTQIGKMNDARTLACNYTK